MQGSGLDAKIAPGSESAAREDVVQPLHWELGEKLEPEQKDSPKETFLKSSPKETYLKDSPKQTLLKDSPKETFLKDSPKKLQQSDLSFPSPPCDAWMYNVDMHKVPQPGNTALVLFYVDIR